MKSLKNWSPAFLFLFFAAWAAFSSCEKDDISTSKNLTTEEATTLALTVMEESGELGCSGCFTLVYPVTIILPDESEVAVDSREAAREAIIAYLQANPPQGDRPFRRLRALRPHLAFPYDVQLEDGSLMTITSQEDLAVVLEACGFDPDRPNGPGRGGSHGQFGGLNHCFNIVFPISLAFPDGTTASGNDRLEVRQLIREWRLNNPDATERPTLAFPFDVELQDGTVVTVGSREDLADLRENCGGNVGDGHGMLCFTLNYPVSVAFPDGSTAEVNNREEVITAWMTWLETNPDAEGRPSLVFPLSVTYTEDGSTAEVASALELRQLRRDCW